MRSPTRNALRTGCALLALCLAPAAVARDGAEVLENVCSSCHAKTEDGGYERIDAVRKTPEAWDMTVVRMMRNHAVVLTDEDRIAVVRYLSETHGLTVAETDGWRYILEKEPVASDAGPDQLMTETCGRCHSYARVALQRRTPEDWEHLVNFHLGQFPTLEYQALARDRDWWGIAQSEIIPYLAEHYPLGEAPAAAETDLSGTWVVAGRMPGRGDYSGTLTLAAAGDMYDVTMALDFADGSTSYSGTGLLLGAGEWRAALSDGETPIRQVFALTADGTLEGRWFETEHDVIGGRLVARPETAAPAILAVSPAHLRAGETAEVRITGTGLSGDPVLPEGVSGEVVRASAEEVVLSLTAADALGPVAIGLGGLEAPDPLVVYDTLDRISVVPELTMARIGGNGGPIPKVPAQFEAMGWLNGPDGAPATEDDIPVGIFPAGWSVDNFDEAAAEMEDAKFAGTIDAAGFFTPGDAGPNPERPMSTNNAGNLKVIATVEDGGESLTGEAHLYATVQRFVDTPIR